MKVVINRRYGGYSLSRAACERLAAEKCGHVVEVDGYGFTHDSSSERSCPALVKVVEEMSHAADGMCAKLAVVEIPDGVDFEIDEYDGLETVDEKHRSWP
jgi:hypothetical protein